MKTNKPPNPKINKAKQNERRSAHKRTWGLFYVGQIPLSMKTTLDVQLRYTMAHHWTKLYLPFPSMYQLQITSWIGEKFCVYSPSQCQNLSPPKFFCVLSQSVSSYVINHIVSGRSFLWCYPTPLDLRIFPLSDLHRSLSVDWRGLM